MIEALIKEIERRFPYSIKTLNPFSWEELKDEFLKQREGIK